MSVFIVAAITVTVILLVHFNVILELSTWWFTIVIIGGLGLVFEFWSVSIFKYAFDGGGANIVIMLILMSDELLSR